ncbi:hypothetical protein YC2023_081190 [Brassica napus]
MEERLANPPPRVTDPIVLETAQDATRVQEDSDFDIEDEEYSPDDPKHTGIVVYGNEYFFGGGIQYLPAGTTPYGAPLRTVELGESHVPKDGPVRLLTQVIHLGEDATRCSFCVL